MVPKYCWAPLEFLCSSGSRSLVSMARPWPPLLLAVGGTCSHRAEVPDLVVGEIQVHLNSNEMSQEKCSVLLMAEVGYDSVAPHSHVLDFHV